MQDYLEMVPELGQVWIDTTGLPFDAVLSREDEVLRQFPGVTDFDFDVRGLDGRRYSVLHS